MFYRSFNKFVLASSIVLLAGHSTDKELWPFREQVNTHQLVKLLHNPFFVLTQVMKRKTKCFYRYVEVHTVGETKIQFRVPRAKKGAAPVSPAQ